MASIQEWCVENNVPTSVVEVTSGSEEAGNKVTKEVTVPAFTALVGSDEDLIGVALSYLQAFPNYSKVDKVEDSLQTAEARLLNILERTVRMDQMNKERASLREDGEVEKDPATWELAVQFAEMKGLNPEDVYKMMRRGSGRLAKK